MSQHYYYETEDLQDFPNIGEFAPEQGKKFFEYYATATSVGKLTEREKALIALTVATVDCLTATLIKSWTWACPSTHPL